MSTLSEFLQGLMLIAHLANKAKKNGSKGYIPGPRNYHKRKGKYIHGGSAANVRGSKARGNPNQINAMHEKWLAEQFPSRVAKKVPDPASISQIKLQHRCHRSVARKIKEGKAV